MTKTILDVIDEGLKGQLFINRVDSPSEILLYESLELKKSDLRIYLSMIGLGNPRGDKKPRRINIPPIIQHKYQPISVEEAEKENPYIIERIDEWTKSQPSGYAIILPRGI